MANNKAASLAGAGLTMAIPTDEDERRALLLYELFAAAGGSKHPPVSPELAQFVAERVPKEELAAVERLYRALEQAWAGSGPTDTLEALFARLADILDHPH